MDNEIIANTENIDRVVSAFAAELDSYIASMESELAGLSAAVTKLGEGWVSDDYDRFRETMQAKIRKIEAEMRRAGELKTYLDETAGQFRELLRILREGAEA